MSDDLTKKVHAYKAVELVMIAFVPFFTRGLSMNEYIKRTTSLTINKASLLL